ncbi:DNA-3-methyladenine glycosylase 2 family protein [Microbacteriaceae bacterium VKM Ac-2854]|nr:DNA-3-methyladenine glycosylase 2 family protein [Microbacteriaceae bacterium VKM Ac-2854]
MHLDSAAADSRFAERYRAVASRDARFDGQFITGVHSTGIYCRPSCPATTPKPGNVSFYLTAAAAHEAGLRACKRCLPDAVPGSPEWNLRDDTAARAMRLIADGVVDREGVDGLAARLGYGTRHLGRILTGELGAGPLALARAQRAQTARTLLMATDLPVSDVAFAAGFASIRQFNATIAEVYERTPSQLRSSARTMQHSSTSEGTTTLTLRLPARAPFDAEGVLGFLAARAILGVELAGDGSYTRSLQLPGGPAVVALRSIGSTEAPAIECTATVTAVSDVAPLVARIRRLLDLDADAAAIDAALAADAQLAPLVAATPGIRLPGTVDAHEIIVRALIGQQVSVAAARTALARLTAALGAPLPFAAPVDRLFPNSAAIAEHGREVLRGPARRIDTIIRVAEALTTGELHVDVAEPRADLSQQLQAIPGIGPWTAGYVAMRVVGAPDVLLTSDLAIRAGAASLGLPAAARALDAAGASWAPWRSYAGMHLWRAAADRAR